MDVVAMVRAYDGDVVDVGSQTVYDKRNHQCQEGLLFTLRTATRVRVLQSFAVHSPESKLQKTPGARHRLRANGMTEWAITHRQLHCGPTVLPTRTAKLIVKPF